MGDRLTPKEAAEILGYSVDTLKRWRQGEKQWRPGLGPKFYTIHGRIFYRRAWLEDWERLHYPSGGTMDNDEEEPFTLENKRQ